MNLVKLEYNIVISEFIQFMVSDGHFMAEIGLMGSGLQMWLQIIWFLCRTQGSYTVILDEPDVYMHPDLQRKLLQLVRKYFKQVIIATHSIEIISEVEPSNIVMINKKSRKMQYANGLLAVQQIVDNIGGMQDLSLIRIGLKKKCLFVEGKDIKILSKVFDKLYPEEENDIGTLPCLSLGGFMRLPEAFGAANLFYKETQNSIKCMAILDRDYYPDTLLADIYDKAKENHLDLHIWNKKEIENYFIVPQMLFRLVRTKNVKEDYENFLQKLDSLLEEFRDDVQEQIVEQMVRYKKGCAVSTCMASARKLMQEKWSNLDSKIAMVSGKEMIRRVNVWLKTEYQVSSSLDKMIKELRKEEIDEELVGVLEKLC
ncbi:AAA family ATPase [Lachnospiraceae bacterium 62-35]